MQLIRCCKRWLKVKLFWTLVPVENEVSTIIRLHSTFYMGGVSWLIGTDSIFIRIGSIFAVRAGHYNY